jgi:uncharacterized protein with HEPN domain
MRRDALLLAEMIDAAEQAIALVKGRGTDDLEHDRTARDALLWNFMVLGEAAATASDEIRRAHPDVPWRLAAALRNRIVHGYWSIDLDIVHSTATDVLPGLVEQLRAVMANDGDERPETATGGAAQE